MPPLQLIHSDAVYASGLGKMALAYWRAKTTQEIRDSLLPGKPEALKVKPDGRVVNGNTRLKVLIERGEDIDLLPREDVP